MLAGALLLVVMMVDSGSRAVAQDAAAPGAQSAGDIARKRMEKGQALFAAGKYADAMTEFEAAYEAQPYGAFLYNAAFAAEKAGDRQRAVARYREYLASDPTGPDAEEVKATIARLEQELTVVPTIEGGGGGSGGEGGGGGEGGEGGGAAAQPEPIAPPDEQTMKAVRSLVLVESEPPGAPLSIYERVIATAAPFRDGAENSGWRQIITGAQTPKDLSLKVGHYQVVIEAFQDYKRSETSINLAAGHVYTFKANLSQGEFVAHLRVNSKVEGAKIWVDDPPPHKKGVLWGRTPAGDYVNEGEHHIFVEKPGYKPWKTTINAKHGESLEVEAELERVEYGYLIIDGNVDELEIEIDEPDNPDLWTSGTKPRRIKLPAGPHSLVLDASGHKEYEATIEVPRGQELRLHANLNESYPRGKAIALGVLAVGAGVGSIFTYRESKRPIDTPHSEDTLKVFEVSTYVAWGAAGLFAGLSIFYSIYDPYPESLVKAEEPNDFPETDAKEEPKTEEAKTEEKSAYRYPFIAPIIGPNTGGVSIGGFF